MEEKCRKVLPPGVTCSVGVYSAPHSFDNAPCSPTALAALPGIVEVSRGSIEFQASTPGLTVGQGPRFDIPGPMMKTVRDPALSLIALSGIDPKGRIMAQVPPVVDSSTRQPDTTLTNWRIGFADEYLRNDVREPVEHSNEFLQALEVLRAAGAEVVPVVAQLLNDAAYFSLDSSNEIDKRVIEHRLDALVSDGQSPAFHCFCKTGHPGVCQTFNDALHGTHVVLWFYGARWARDSLSALVRVYQQAMHVARTDVPER